MTEQNKTKQTQNSIKAQHKNDIHKTHIILYV